MKIYIWLLGSLLLGLTSCSVKKTVSLQKTDKVQTNDTLSAEAQRKYEYFFLEAVRLKEQGEYDAAFETYERCLEIIPDAASALYEISQFHLFLKQPDKGQEALEKSVNKAPDNFWYKQTLGAFYQAKGETERAIGIYEEMANQFPTREEPLMILVDLYNRMKNYPQVIRTLDRLEERIGKSEQISMEKFRIYLTMNNDKKAFNEIENLAEEYPNDMRYLIILGDVYLNNGKTEEAYETYRKVLAEEPDNAMGLLSMASYYQKTGEDSLYRKQLDKVLLNKKVETETKLNIMRQLIGQSEATDKDSIQIISLFDSMMEQKQEDAQLPMMYASYLISKGMTKESFPVLKEVLEIDPENVAARLQLLSYALQANDTQEAIRITEPALQYSPEVLEFYYYLGLAYYQEDRREDALNTYLKGLEQVTEKSNKMLISDFYSMVGELYYAKKMKAQAYAAYDSSLVYNPDNIGTLNNYAYYLSVEKENLDRAEEMSYKTVKAEPKNGTFLDTYAWILFEKGRYAEAKVYIDDAMKNGGEESDVVVEHCGDIYYMNGEKEKALEYWQKALELGSQSEVLKKKIAEKKLLTE